MWNVQPKLGSSRFRRGFTMVEILVVVAIIGILSSIAVPMFLRSTAENSLDGDASTFFLELQKLKSTAVRSGNHVRMTITNATKDAPLTWKVEQYDPVAKDYVNPKVFTASRRDVVLGVPESIKMPLIESDFKPFFLNMLPLTENKGLYTGLASNQCVDLKNATTSTTESWADGTVESCGGPVGDMESGMLCMRTTKSDARAYCFAFNRTTSLAIQQYRYMGDSWEKQ